MTEKISVVNSNHFGGFENFKIANSIDKYWILKEEKEKKDEYILGTSSLKDFIPIEIMTPEKARKTNNMKIIGLSIAGATILSASAIFFLLKGGPKSLSKNFIKLRNYVQRKVLQSRLNKPNLAQASGFYLFLLGKLNILVNKFEAINNLTTLKDYALKEVFFSKNLDKTFGKTHRAITKTFEKIGRNTVKASYSSSLKSFLKTKLLMNDMNIKILSSNPKELVQINGMTKTRVQWLQLLTKMSANLELSYNRYFGQNALNSRYLGLKRASKALDNNFKNRGHFWFWSKETLNSFVAESEILNEKTLLKNNVSKLRKNLSFNLGDLANEFDKNILKIMEDIDYNDIESIKILQRIQQNIKKYSLNSKNNPKLKIEIIKQMDILVNHLTEIVERMNLVKDKNGSEKLISVQNNISRIIEMKSLFTNYKQGQIEDLLDIYRKILPPSDYKKLEKQYKKFLSKLDSSINIETEDFVNKVRDLTMGSAPTDILSILMGFLTLGYYVGTTEGKDKKQSVAVKYGIPAISGIGTALYCNARLFAGSKSLLMSSISTAVIGKISSFIDDLLKKENK